MRILYIHQYFKTPKEPGGTRSYWLAKKLVEEGHEVVMLSSTEAISARKEVREIDGIEVVYIKNAYDQSMNIMRRLWSFVRFMFLSSKYAFSLKDIDLVIATSTPLTVGVPPLLLKWLRSTPYVFEVRDLWPEVPIQMGAIKNRFAIWLLRHFERTIYKNAVHVIALSPGMQAGVCKYVPIEKTSMIPNMAKKDEFWPRSKDNDVLISIGLKPETFKVIHFGALGKANGADTIIDAAKLLKADDSIAFLFVGGGSTEELLREECSKFGLSNVKFLGKFPMTKTSEIVNLCDVSIISFKDLPILYTNSPNKFFDSLSAGKPILVNSAGWTKDIVESHAIGFYVNPNKPEELVNKIRYLQSNPEVVERMGQNARILAQEKYDKSILSEQFVSVIRGLNIIKKSV